MALQQPLQQDGYRAAWLQQFRAVSYRHGEWKVFQDFVRVSSCVISNTLDHHAYPIREQEYLALIQQYSPAEQEKIAKLHALLYMAYQEQPGQDFLGSMYEELRLTSDRLSQYFTPYPAASVMAAGVLQAYAALPEGEEIHHTDPACGSGVMLIALFNHCQEQRIPASQLLLQGQDLDPVVARMCYIQLSMLRCAAVISIGDSQTGACGLHSAGEKWLTPEYLGSAWLARRQQRGWLTIERRIQA
ncbi:N-6 DNA methylase [Paenibacillus bovis]|uniref:DNA methylase adenine-specific domain-containing protein n=1 Tax=Paenibacillus bovis TaxID=1616788 RepID=A0A1X9T470_9BACL|nr:N-6 DNA methylase [Paenibacillus bovis]ARR10666.1 hypothetical protein AR543_p0058 [Paenibacillus bovis]